MRAVAREPCRAWRRDAGFTLIEMLVALMLVALMATIALPLARGGTARRDIEVSARLLANTLRQLQSEAVRAGAARSLLLDVAERAYRRDDQTAWTRLPDGVGIDATVAAAEIVAPRTLRLAFHPDGSASGGTLVLSERHRRMTIAVDWLSGRIDMRGGG